MTDDLRPKVVTALSEPAQLPAALVDQVLDATDEERATAAGELLDRTRGFLEQAGVLRPSQSILDLGHDQMMVISAVYGLVMPWWAQPGWQERPLGHMLKVVSGDVAESVMRLLRIGRFLPPEEAQPEE